MTRTQKLSTKLHFHITNTPLFTRERFKARDIRRHLERDQLKGKLPTELATAKFRVVECTGECIPPKGVSDAK